MYAEFMRNGSATGGVSKGGMENGIEKEDYMGGGVNGGVDAAVNGEGRVVEIRSP